MSTPVEDQRLRERGEKCELWGRPTSEMSRDELLTFVGYLDDVVTYVIELGRRNERDEWNRRAARE